MLSREERIDVIAEVLVANSLESEFKASALTVQKNGDLTFFLAYQKKHNFSGVIFTDDENVAVNLSIGFFKSDAEEVGKTRERMKKASESPAFREGENNWMRFGFDKNCRHIVVLALIKVDQGKEANRVNALFYYDGKITSLFKNISDNWEIFAEN